MASLPTIDDDRSMSGVAPEAAPEPPPFDEAAADDRGGNLLKISLVALFTWALLGQKCMMTLAVWLHLPTRVLTVPSHMLTLGLAGLSLVLVLLAASRGRLPLHWTMLPFAAFWACYGFRILSDFLAMGTPGAPPPDATFSVDYVAQRALGSCLIPAVAILLNQHWGFHRKTQAWCFALAITTAIAFLGMYQDNILHFERRMKPGEETGEYTTISALQMGYAGLALFAFILHKAFSGERTSIARWLPVIAVTLVGVLLVIGSASRGPLIALGIMVLPLGASLYARGRKLKALQFAIACGVLAVAGIVVAEMTGSSVFDRLMSLHEDVEQESAGSERLIFYTQAMEAFAKNPLFGYQTTIGGFAYPHNVFLEALMATGLVGTLALSIVIGWAIRCSWRILVDAPALSWLPLTFLASFGGALFTGALFTNSGWWVSMVGTISAAQWMEREAQEADEEADLAPLPNHP